MTTYATARRLDALGRVVLPADLRKVLGLHTGDLLTIEVAGDRIIMAKAWDQCVLCNATEQLVEYRDKLVCKNCVETLSVTA